MSKIRKIRHNSIKKTLTKLKIGRSEFLKKYEKKRSYKMISKYDKIFASLLNEIGCINPKIIVPMVIFIISHVP